MVFVAQSVVNTAEPSGGGAVDIRGDDEEEVVKTFSSQEKREITQMAQDPHLYDKFVRSIAPTVHGHSDIKRAITLMLFGGVHKSTGQTNLRGDINVLIVGSILREKSVPEVCHRILTARRVYFRQELFCGWFDGNCR